MGRTMHSHIRTERGSTASYWYRWYWAACPFQRMMNNRRGMGLHSSQGATSSERSPLGAETFFGATTL
jgi:hypothetical protein